MRAYIDTKAGWLIVDASSFRKAEELTSTLRSSLGSLPVMPPMLKHSPASIMTGWLEHHNKAMPQFMVLGDECELKDLGEEGGHPLQAQDLLPTKSQPYRYRYAGQQVCPALERSTLLPAGR